MSKPADLLASARRFARKTSGLKVRCAICLLPEEERAVVETLRAEGGMTYPAMAAWLAGPKDHKDPDLRGLGHEDMTLNKLRNHFESGHHTLGKANG